MLGGTVTLPESKVGINNHGLFILTYKTVNLSDIEVSLYRFSFRGGSIDINFLCILRRYTNNLGRQNLEFGQNLRTTLLDQQCPLRGIPRCALPSKRYRTADGTCNNIEEPWKGSSMTPMQRFLPPTYEDGKQNILTIFLIIIP